MLRLLISTYACSPRKGSEHGVGWNWVTQAARLGHRVTALVCPSHRDAILSACAADSALAGIEWVFPVVPLWHLPADREPKRERTYNLLWQVQALRVAKLLHRAEPFDAVHHLTWGGIRAPSFLGALGAPLVIGPVGGGETSPKALRTRLRLKARLTEWVRDMSNATIAFNPVVRDGLRSSRVIFAKTPETRELMPAEWRGKTELFCELTLRPEDISTPRAAAASPPRLLCVGRLLYWKGTHIALDAFATLLRSCPEARLTILGDGPERGRLEAQARRLGVDRHVDFRAWLPREAVRAVYETHDLLLFPSLHDSSGNVVLEAFARGLPVISLDIGGPAVLVTREAGLAICTRGNDSKGVAAAIGTGAARLLHDRDTYARLSRGAVARAGDFLLNKRVDAFYGTCAAAVLRAA